jgi:hypothetical protein
VAIAVHLASSTSTQQTDAKTATTTCCKIHGEPLKLHCDTCDKTICMECGSFEHDGHKKVRIADLTDEAREAILHQVDCTSTTTKQLGEAKVQLQACCGQVEVTADASKQAVNAFAKQVRQALSASIDAVTAQVDDSTSRKRGASHSFLAFIIGGGDDPSPLPHTPHTHPRGRGG